MTYKEKVERIRSLFDGISEDDLTSLEFQIRNIINGTSWSVPAKCEENTEKLME